jgi:branched-chain amino acid transport system substrate-binding protein
MRFTPLRAVAVCAALALTTTACGSVGEDSSSSDSSGQENGQAGPIKVGLVIPQSGVYAPLGEDMKAAWDLWLEQHGNRIGGREVETVVVDEGEGPDTGVPAVQKVLQQDRVDTVVGIVNSATALGAVEPIESAKKVLVVANAGADQLTGSSKYIWRTSFTNGQVAYSVGKYLAGTPEGKKGVYAMAADYAAGEEAIAGFKKGFEEAGGKLVGEAKTPFGTTQDFQPFLAKARSAKPGAVYVFYAGAEAVSFVKQYKEFGLSDSAALYGSGFLTEGGVLTAQGEAAEGVKTALHYATALDNPANKTFSEAYQAKTGKPPTVYAVQAWDAAAVLDKAVKAAGALDGDALSGALGSVGEVSDSPRGTWSFENQSPIQEMYLREVKAEGDAVTNVVAEDLGQVPPAP